MQHDCVNEHTSSLSTCVVDGVTDFRTPHRFRLPRTFLLQNPLFSQTEGYQRLPMSGSIRLTNYVLDLLLNPLHAQLRSNHLIKGNPNDIEGVYLNIIP